ncbi:MAG TPA: hypothetical protein VE396_11605 [Xanthobacteraceae bacterium]|jgi:hypothetical protein|nr:hypothetical protein [Xanthobacteraceae bacterium]
MTVIAEAGRDVPMTRLPMSEMTAHCGAFPIAEVTMTEVTAGPMVHIVVAEMPMVFAVREAMVGEVARKVSGKMANKAMSAAKAMRCGIDLGQGETKEDGGRNSEWCSQGHRALSEELFGAGIIRLYTRDFDSPAV